MIAFCGCASQSQTVPAVYVFEDQPDQDRIKVSFINDTNRRVCLTPEHWPNQAGKIHQAESVALVVDGTEYLVEYFNVGFCVDCALAVKPGETVSAFISYDDFSLPEELRNASKELRMPAFASSCR